MEQFDLVHELDQMFRVGYLVMFLLGLALGWVVFSPPKTVERRVEELGKARDRLKREIPDWASLEKWVISSPREPAARAFPRGPSGTAANLAQLLARRAVSDVEKRAARYRKALGEAITNEPHADTYHDGNTGGHCPADCSTKILEDTLRDIEESEKQ